MKRKRIDIITLGCSKNLVDSEQLMRQLEEVGYSVTHDTETPQGEIAVINTCSQARVIHIRSQVVAVDLTVIVDISLQVAGCSRHFEYVQFAAGTVISYTFRNGKFDIACSRTGLEAEYLHITVAFPIECTRLCPMFLIHAIIYRTFQ